MMHRLISLHEPEAWNAELADLPHSYFHSWEHAQAEALRSGTDAVLYTHRSDAGRWVCPLLLRDHESYTDVAAPTGFSGFAGTGSASAVHGAWQEFAAGQGWVCSYMLQHPLAGVAPPALAEEMTDGPAVFILDLTCREADLLSAMSRCRRRQIKAWGADPGWLCRDADEIVDFLARHGPDFYGRIGYRGAIPDRRMWRFLADSQGSLLLGARAEGRLVAANLFFQRGPFADAPFNISIPEGRDAATPLMWAGARVLKERGARSLNMGGGASPGDAIAQAKRRFNCLEVKTVRVRQVFRPDVFQALCARGAQEAQGFFPPYRARAAA